MRKMVRPVSGGFVLTALAGLLVLPGCWNPFNRDEGRRETTAAPVRDERPWWKPWGSNKPSNTYRGPDYQEPMAEQAPEPVENPSDFIRATELVKQQQFAEAKSLLRTVIEQNPNHAEAYRWLGDCFYNLMDLENAIGAYTTARELDPTNYFALRGKGFAHLHMGHEKWRVYEDALRKQDRAAAHSALSEAHENYKRALEVLQHALRVFPGDNEAMYGRAMAAEGASRKLYANAVGLLKKNDRQNAQAWAENCLDIIDEGIEAAKVRVREYPERAGPRKLAGGLFFRRAMLLKAFGETQLAMDELKKAAATQQSILQEVDPENDHAQRELQRCKSYLEKWQRELERG